MFHLSNFLHDSLFSEKNEDTTSAGVLFGCYTFFTLIPPTAQLGIMFNWEVVITLLKAGITFVIMPMISSLAKDVYEKRIKPKIFKNKNDGKEKRKKTETKKRA